MPSCSRASYRCLLVAAGMLLHSAAMATEHVASISGIEVINDGTNDMVAVSGTFTPSLPCVKQGFWLYNTEAYFKEIYSVLLLAKATGSTVKFTHVYCHANGYSRGNHFMLQ